MRAILAIAWFIVAQSSASAQHPAAFEVASVKPAQPLPRPLTPGVRLGCGGGPGTSDPGSWRCTFVNLAELIRRAYGLEEYQFAPADWMNQARFDVIAKVPPNTTKPELLEMEQALLAERFKLAIHLEKKEMQVYELVVGKREPKLKETAPETALAAEEPGTIPKVSIGKDMFPTFPSGHGGLIGFNGHFRWVASGVTIEDLVKILSAHLGRPVTDGTGLTGKYDINMYWLAEGVALAPPGGEPQPGASAPSLAGAVQEQLGLKLNSGRGSVDTLVVDHVERAPVEN